MKIHLDIDCTPDEARRFLGLPDVAELQARVMSDLSDRLHAAIAGADAETLLKTWLPAGLKTLDEMQKSFWSQMAAAGGRKSEG